MLGFLGKWERQRDVAKERKKNILPLPVARQREEEDEQCNQNNTVFSCLFFRKIIVNETTSFCTKRVVSFK
jgi:hypothetical protein